MFSYFVRRTLIALLTLVLITFLIYGLIRAMPGSPLTGEMMDPSRRLDPADIARMERAFGLDKPWYEAYGVWLTNLLQFDMGRSLHQKQPVADLIVERMGPTLLLSVTSLVLAYLLSIPMGLYASVRSGKTDERVMSTILYMLYSFPSFVAALLLQIIFAVKLGWLPLLGMYSSNYETMTTSAKVWDVFLHALMPVACYTYGSLAYYSRFIRPNMLDVVQQDYIRTARTNGVS